MRKILVTNDDGLSAQGLHVLATVLASAYDVYIVAPDQERSGVSHAFTLLNPLRVDPAPEALPENLIQSVYRCSGTPVDCVKMGLLTLFPDIRFDLVVSGINPGANLSIDTLYSGTVAGAMEALIMGYPAIAVSLVSHPEQFSSTRTHFETAAEVCFAFLRQHEEKILANRRFILNMNVPNLPRDEIQGIRHTAIGRCRYLDRYEVHNDPKGRPYYWLDGQIQIEDERDCADILAVRSGWVSISPLWYDLTATGGLDELASWTQSESPSDPSSPRRRG